MFLWLCCPHCNDCCREPDSTCTHTLPCDVPGCQKDKFEEYIDNMVIKKILGVWN